MESILFRRSLEAEKYLQVYTITRAGGTDYLLVRPEIFFQRGGGARVLPPILLFLDRDSASIHFTFFSVCCDEICKFLSRS